MTNATEKTLARLNGALRKYDVGDLLPALIAQVDAGISQTAASAMIELVEALPMTAAAAAAKANKVTEAGFYEHPADGRVVKVQISKAGHPYAMDRDGAKWRFVSGLISELDATRRVAEAPAVAAAASVSVTEPAVAALLAELAARNAS
jgi:hypothetical protein